VPGPSLATAGDRSASLHWTGRCDLTDAVSLHELKEEDLDNIFAEDTQLAPSTFRRSVPHRKRHQPSAE
jgi:hypothetical protein